ncbi:MAG TPA: family 43 glycosylhydrolase, partial [Acidimicrobiales bacterium]|nr:family 43 glycosylhydrolase [Acidimicrobiales bacterium]
RRRGGRGAGPSRLHRKHRPRPGGRPGGLTTATNPVIAGFHPDPSVCRVGDDFYLACSSFEYWPALPLFHSRDLVHWRQIGNAVDRPGQLDLTGVPSSLGVTAPTLRHHDGRFWLAGTVYPGYGHFILTADDPAGPWSDPVPVALPGIDPDLAWDADGTCWFTYYGIRQATIDPVTGEVRSPPVSQWSGAEGSLSPEAPHLYRVGDTWYLLIAEGGTERGHSVSVARGPGPAGPFTPCPANPVLTHRGLAHPVQNTGHGDLVKLADGSWWMVVLGVRPKGVTPMFHTLGRETFLTRVRWEEGWPVVDPVSETFEGPDLAGHPWPDPPVRDRFAGGGLGPQWISVRCRSDEEVKVAGAGLGLTAGPDAGDGLDGRLPTFVGRRQQHHHCRAAARLHVGGGAGGLGVRLDERHHAEVSVEDGRVTARVRAGDLLHEAQGDALPGAGPVDLVVEARPAKGWGAGPDTLALGYMEGDSMVTLASVDGRYLSTEVAGGFTGRVIGVFTTGGSVAVEWFDYRPL